MLDSIRAPSGGTGIEAHVNDVIHDNGRWIARASITTAAGHDPAARALSIDVLAVVIATLLPWSMSGVVVFVVIWIGWLSIALNPCTLLRQLKRPAWPVPLMLPVPELLCKMWFCTSIQFRLYAISPTAKLPG